LRAREARAALHYITPEWLQSAFWRHDGKHPELAATLSNYENFYEIQTVQLLKHAAEPILSDWPDLPLI
jgi:hypothetical protein